MTEMDKGGFTVFDETTEGSLLVAVVRLSFFYNDFTDNGWCKSRARQLCQSYDYLAVSHLASLDLKQLGSPAHLHNRCQMLENCVAHQISDTSSAYPFRHVEQPDLFAVGSNKKRMIAQACSSI
jgi:hypothetical protein